MEESDAGIIAAVNSSLDLTNGAPSRAVERHTPFFAALTSGGLAGTTVDIALFPIDTVKTRLQSPQGFLEAGGFRGVYRGLGAAAAGSAPGAALFFSVYEGMKPRFAEWQDRYGFMEGRAEVTHMAAACMGETAACLVRVPTEVVKSAMQVGGDGTATATLSSTVKSVLNDGGAHAFMGSAFGGLYRGYGITLMREIPFALIQFPIYERAKVEWASYQRKEVSPLQAAACGSFGGAIAAAFTTPLDFMKTRLMLGKDRHGVPYKNALDVARRSVAEEGMGAIFKGIQPRVMWISIGGFVFFGAYETFRASML